MLHTKVTTGGRLLLLAIATVAIGITLSGQTPGATYLGVVRADGLLIPVFIYDGHDWWNRWPFRLDSDEIRALPVPPSIQQIPGNWLPPGMQLPADWNLILRSGVATKLRLRQPTRPRDPTMMDTIAVQTDYRVIPEDARGLFFEGEIGVAMAGAGELGGFRVAPREESQRILARLDERLQKIETVELARWRQAQQALIGDGPEPLEFTGTVSPDGTRSDLPFTLKKAARTFNNRTYYYLTGEKRYRNGLKAGSICEIGLAFEGVVMVNRDGSIFEEEISAGTLADQCGDVITSMEPLATLQRDGRVIWLVNESSEDGYHYELFDPNHQPLEQVKGSWEPSR